MGFEDHVGVVGVPKRERKGAGIVPTDAQLHNDQALEGIRALSGAELNSNDVNNGEQSEVGKNEQALSSMRAEYPVGSKITVRGNPMREATVFGHKLYDQAGLVQPVAVIKDRHDKMAYVTKEGALVAWGMAWEDQAA